MSVVGVNQTSVTQRCERLISEIERHEIGWTKKDTIYLDDKHPLRLRKEFDRNKISDLRPFVHSILCLLIFSPVN